MTPGRPATIDKPMPGSECRRRFRFLNAGLTLILAGIGVVLSIVGWSWSISVEAAATATEAKATADTNQTEMTTSFSFLREGIGDIKKEQAAQRVLLNEMAREKRGE